MAAVGLRLSKASDHFIRRPFRLSGLPLWPKLQDWAHNVFCCDLAEKNNFGGVGDSEAVPGGRRL